MASENWKQKYLRQLDDNERQLNEWQKERYALQRLIVRTSLVAEGQNQALDRLLGELRELARQETPDITRLRQLQKRLDRQVNAFDDSRQNMIARIAKALEAFTESLRERADGKQKRALRRYSKSMPKRVESYGELPGLLSELADLQKQVLQAEDDQGRAGERLPFLQRLLGRHESGESVAPPVAGETPAPGLLETDPAVAEALDLDSPSGLGQQGAPDARAHTGTPAATSDYSVAAFAHRLAHLLDQLLAQPGFTTATRERMEALLVSARSTRDWQGIRVLLDEISHLILVAIGHGHREFAGFLSSLDERLARIQSQFKGAALDSDRWRAVAVQFEQEFHSELDALGEEAEAATELASLQSATKQHLTRLNSTLTEYREAESERENQLQSQVTTLQQRLTEMEEQSRSMQEALSQERIRATTDLLTQLPNRDALEEQLQHEFSRWQRYRHEVSLAVVDIDLFKDVNDRFGHLAGDKVLQLVARCIRESLRAADFVARYGGEEFVVLLPETGAEDAMMVLEKVRKRVAGLPFHFRGEKVQVTLSAGLLPFQPVENLSELFDVADRALYEAKENGRNQLVVAEDRHRRSGPESAAQ